MKDVQATGEGFSLPREHPALQNMKFLNFYLLFVDHFCSGSGSDSDSESGSTDQIESGSGSETLLKIWVCKIFLYFQDFCKIL
jgi:hypothetical protein